jgi:hypothetical protein
VTGSPALLLKWCMVSWIAIWCLHDSSSYLMLLLHVQVIYFRWVTVVVGLQYNYSIYRLIENEMNRLRLKGCRVSQATLAIMGNMLY